MEVFELAQMNIDCSEVLSRVAHLANSMNKLNAVYNRTLLDMVSRAPGKVASAVTNNYGIKKKEINFKKKFKGKSVGYVSAHGETLSTLELYYAGRLLTPLHFGMTPKVPTELNDNIYYKTYNIYPGCGYKMVRPHKKYNVTAKILKGKTVSFRNEQKHPDGAVYLAPARKGSSTIIPWFRYSKDPYDIKPIKTLSLPQMIDNRHVRKEIRRGIDDLYHSRFDNHLKQFIKGNL